MLAEHIGTADSAIGKIGLKVAERIPGLLAYWDKNQICRYANRAYAGIVGWQPEEIINKSSIKEVHGVYYEQNRENIERALQGKGTTYERPWTTQDGKTAYYLVNYLPDISEDEEVLGFFSHATDITNLKALERELVRTTEFEARNKELEQFVHLASHDLQEPLRTITNFVGIIQEDAAGQLDEDTAQHLDIIDTAAKRLRELVQNLRDYSLLGRAGTLEPMDCDALLADVIQDLRQLIQETETVIHINRPLPELQAYPVQLRELFQNLISNAIKFHRAGVKPSIEISSSESENEWEFSIADNGIGIAPQHFQRIFQMFERLKSAPSVAGEGIGLAFCKKIAELHGGRIWVESGEMGSTFKFTISKFLMQ